MNKDTARDYLPLVQALVDGKVLQVLRDPGNGHRQWFDLDGTCFDRAADQYRIKPEPREIWRNRYADGSEGGNYDTRNQAAMGSAQNLLATQVRYREVIE